MSDILPYKQELSNSMAILEKNKQEALAINDPKAYIKNQVRNNAALWWRKWEEDMNSDDPALARAASIEYNKLQCRVLPTELTSPEDGGIRVLLTSYKQLADENNNIAEASLPDPNVVDISLTDEVINTEDDSLTPSF